MKDYINLTFSLLSKRNIKKFLLGELEPTSEELSVIQTYLENIRPKLLQENKSNLIQQIEQQKVPYLKELSIVELDFLLSKNIELPELLKIIFAKGGMAKGFAVIEWDNTLLRYKKRKVSLNWSQGAITLGMTCLFIFVFFPIYGLLGSEQQIQKEIFSHEQYKPFIKE